MIAPPEMLSALKERSGAPNGEVLTFSDADALRALAEIVKRRPHAVELERQFAATPRGAALINRIKSDPALAGSELRVVSTGTDSARVLQRTPAAPQATEPAVAILDAPTGEKEAKTEAAPPAPPTLDRGTRRAPRFRMATETIVQIDGKPATVVDLSTVGAQVISPTIVKPNQRVRVMLADEVGALRFNAVIAWAFFEIPRNGGPQYRAGVNFVDANGDAVGTFCLRHQA